MEEIDFWRQVVNGENPPASIANFILNTAQVILSIASFFLMLYVREYIHERRERFKQEMAERKARTEGRMRTRKTDTQLSNPYDDERRYDDA